MDAILMQISGGVFRPSNCQTIKLSLVFILKMTSAWVVKMSVMTRNSPIKTPLTEDWKLFSSWNVIVVTIEFVGYNYYYFFSWSYCSRSSIYLFSCFFFLIILLLWLPL